MFEHGRSFLSMRMRMGVFSEVNIRVLLSYLKGYVCSIGSISISFKFRFKFRLRQLYLIILVVIFDRGLAGVFDRGCKHKYFQLSISQIVNAYSNNMEIT